MTEHTSISGEAPAIRTAPPAADKVALIRNMCFLEFADAHDPPS
jgi:hypothetical protein